MRFAASLALLLVSSSASGGQVFVKGAMLEGKTVGLTPDGVEFETEYGVGTIVIPWSNIERIESDVSFVLVHGVDSWSRGRVLDVEGDSILFGRDRDTAERIAKGSIYRGFSEENWDASRLTRLRAIYRHWSASLALSGALTEASTNSRSLQIDLEVAHKMGPTRYSWESTYQFADSEDEIGNNEKNQLAKRFATTLRGERDVTKRGFILASQFFEHDDVNDVKERLITQAGAGYRVVEHERGFVAAELSPSFVYERQKAECEGDDSTVVGFDPNRIARCGDVSLGTAPKSRGTKTNSYVGLGMAGHGEVELPYGSKLKIRLDYLPDVINWSGYLLQAKARFTVPILDWLSFRATVDNLLNSDPADDARRNRLTATVGLSLDF